MSSASGPDLYETLGVSRSADGAAIHKAYRSKAKSAHPDSPSGSQEKFALVKLAHDVLSDLERRKKYDETGEFGEKAPDNAEAEAANAAFAAIGEICESIDKQGYDYKHHDIVVDAIRNLNRRLATIRDNRKISLRNVKRVEDLASRLRGKPGKSDRISPMIQARLCAMRQEIEGIDKAEKVHLRAIEMLQDVEFKHEAASSPTLGEITSWWSKAGL